MAITGKFSTKIRETFLRFGEEQITISNGQKCMLLKVECHPIMIFQSVPLVLFVSMTQIYVLMQIYFHNLRFIFLFRLLHNITKLAYFSNLV